MKKVISTYVGQLPQAQQDYIRKQLEAYGLSPAEVQDAMDSKISDITGNPECPIYLDESTAQKDGSIISHTELSVASPYSELSNYYQVDNSGEYDDPEFDDEIAEILADYDLEFQGWAVAQDEFYNDLAADGLDTGVIAKDIHGNIGLYLVIHDSVYPITLEEVESILYSEDGWY